MPDNVESIVFAALKDLVASANGAYRCYADIAPTDTQRPYITYQQVGGQAPNTLGGLSAVRNARMQVNVWADNRIGASSLMAQARGALTDAIRPCVPIGAPVSVYEPDTHLYGARLDFSIWYS